MKQDGILNCIHKNAGAKDKENTRKRRYSINNCSINNINNKFNIFYIYKRHTANLIPYVKMLAHGM